MKSRYFTIAQLTKNRIEILISLGFCFDSLRQKFSLFPWDVVTGIHKYKGGEYLITLNSIRIPFSILHTVWGENGYLGSADWQRFKISDSEFLSSFTRCEKNGVDYIFPLSHLYFNKENFEKIQRYFRQPNIARLVNSYRQYIAIDKPNEKQFYKANGII